MKQIILMIAVVALVGCGKKPAEEIVAVDGEAGESAPETSSNFLETKSRAEAGDAEAQHKLGFMYKNGQGVEQDFKEAVKWWQKAAEQGDILAETYAQMLLKEHPELQQNPKKRGEFAETSKVKAEAGDAEAQFNLGNKYYHQVEVEDFKEAVKWYQKAADQGHAGAQTSLGQMYRLGQGVKQDFEKAIKLHQKAADQGYARAQTRLGVMYGDGTGVEQNDVTAFAWWNIATTNGNQSAKNIKSFIARRMTAAQIAEAEELVKEMVKKNPKLLNTK
jgi:TPR repeat protein